MLFSPKYFHVPLPLAYAVEAYRRGELSREEAALAVIFAVLYDGSARRGEIQLAIGDPEKEESPIITRDHFTVFWLWALREFGLRSNAVYRGNDAYIIVFRGNKLNELLKAITPMLPLLYQLRGAFAEFADAFKVVTHEVVKRKFSINWTYDIRNERFFKKLEEIITMAEDYIYRNVTVERGPLDTSGQWPKAVIRFKLGGEEAAHITVYWTGKTLQVIFVGSREKTEHLASILRALGGDAKVKRVSEGWETWLNTDGITAIRHDKWLNAVRGFVDELYGKGLISEDRYKQLVRDIEAGPNVVKFAELEFSAYYTNKSILVEYKSTSDASKNAAVNALRARGLKEGVHFTVNTVGAGRYRISVVKEAYAKSVEALTQSGLKEKEHYTVYDKSRVIHVKKEHKDAVVRALKAAGLEEGKHFAAKWSGQYIIYITSEGLREIQRMALKGDAEAERFIRDLEEVLKRRYGDNVAKKLMEVLTPAREEGTIDLPLAVYDEKGNVVARIINLRHEFVKGDQPVDQCNGENCRLRIIAEYEADGEISQLKIEWHWVKKQDKKGKTTATYYFEMAWLTVKDDVEAAVLKALTGKAKRGKVYLYADQLDALRRFKPLKDAINQWRKNNKGVPNL